MNPEKEPTNEGRRRFPGSGGYDPDFDAPCTCEPSCARRCDGSCGCEAHAIAFAEFCDAAGLFGPEGKLVISDAEAVARYRGYNETNSDFGVIVRAIEEARRDGGSGGD